MTTKAPTVTPVPHDWMFENWPPSVYPYDGARARHVVRQHQDALRKCGALGRPGHALVIFGGPYIKWLASTAARVDYALAPNQPEHAGKRAGQAGKAARAKAEEGA
jgi:hypothetical protein